MLAHPSEYMVGMDIGTTHVSIVIGQLASHNDLEIKGYVRVPLQAGSLQYGAIKNLDNVKNAAEEAIRIVCERAGMESIKSVVANIGGHETRFCIQNGTMIVDMEADYAISFSKVMQLRTAMSKTNVESGYFTTDILPRMYRLDNSDQDVYEPIGCSANKLEGDFSFLLHPYSNVNNLTKSILNTGVIDIKKVTSSLAPGMAVLSKADKSSGVVVVDIGAGTIDIAIYNNNYLEYACTLGLGGDAITNDIHAKCNNITREFAEKLKIENGTAWPEDAQVDKFFKLEGVRNKPAGYISEYVLSCIIADRVEEMANAVFQVLLSKGFEKSTQLKAGIILTGGCASLKGIKEMFEFVTGFTTEIGNPAEFIISSGNATEILKKPQWATSIGLLAAAYLSLDQRDNDKLSQVRDYYEQQYLEKKRGTPISKPVVVEEAAAQPKKSLLEIFGNFLGNGSVNDEYTS